MDERRTGKVAGRPRDPEVETKILAIALAQMAEQGYARMSIDSVAAEAGIGKPAIYRRWKGKPELAFAALERLRISEPEVNTGTTLGDLVGILENFRTSLLRPNGMALVGTVLAEESHTPELLRLFRENLVTPRRRALREVLERGAARGELRDDVSVKATVSMLVGAVYAQYLAKSEVSPRFVRRVVETCWNGITAQR